MKFQNGKEQIRRLLEKAKQRGSAVSNAIICLKKTGRNDTINKKLIPFVQCKFSSSILAEALGIPVSKVRRIVKEKRIYTDTTAVSFISYKKNKREKRKMLFSPFGCYKIANELPQAYDENSNVVLHSAHKHTAKNKGVDALMALGESSLSDIWDTKEEDEAWNNL